MANVLVEKQSLIDAADAIRSKLGTQDLIAPEDFDDEIEKISVGTGEYPGPYGMVWFWPKVTLSQDGYDQIYGCTVTVEDEDKFLSGMMISDGALRFEAYYNSGVWHIGYGSETCTTEEMLSVYGLEIDNLQTSANMTMYRGYTFDTTEELKKVRLTASTDFAQFATDDYGGTSITLADGTTIVKPGIQVIRFAIGDEVTQLPDYFLNGYTSLTDVNTDYATAVTTIGNSVFGSCKALSCPMKFPAVTTIGNGFLSTSTAFSGTISFPEVTSIGTYFMRMTKVSSVPKFPKLASVGSRFYESSSVVTVSIDAISGVQMTIGERAFENSKLESVYIGRSTFPSSIGGYFCAGCKNLRLIQILPTGDALTAVINAFTTSNYSFSFYGDSSYSKLPVCVSGIPFNKDSATQSAKTAWKTKFPEITSSTNPIIYRKWAETN